MAYSNGHAVQVLNGQIANGGNALEEFTLLDDSDTSQDNNVQDPGGPDHELYTSPILTREAYIVIHGKKTIGQYGVLGKILGIGSGLLSKIPY
ncbi:hypothetical protein AX14_001765 [Amanita brunnescens Koide BX004]|nr:hypothetical protein AX14_001765 [Amanita brunnescens Koide BX004]